MKLIAVLSEERSFLVSSVCESPRLKQSSINRSVPVAMKTRAGRIAWKSPAETSPGEISAAALWPRLSFDCRNAGMWSIVSFSYPPRSRSSVIHTSMLGWTFAVSQGLKSPRKTIRPTSGSRKASSRPSRSFISAFSSRSVSPKKIRR